MRDPMGRSARCALAEAVATFFLVFIGPGAAVVDAATSGAIGHGGISLAFAFVVLAMIYATGHISGAHINPAVTVGFWAAGRFPGRLVVPYIVAQCTGAVGAAFMLRSILTPHFEAGATVPTVSMAGAFGIEVVLSFGLMFVIMAVATDERVSEGFAGIAVGLTVGFCSLMGGPLTGASMNPARSFGPALASGVWEAHWLYWGAPFLGAVFAARSYDFLRPASAPHTVPRGIPLGIEGPISNDVAG